MIGTKGECITIGMNGSMLDEKPSGVGVYSFHLINNLSEVASRNEGEPSLEKRITVFTPSRTHLNSNIRVVKLSNLLQSSRYGRVAAFCRFVWNTVCYPIQARRFDLLISPTTHGSILSDNQIITIHDLISLRYDNISFHQRLYFKYFLPLLLRKAKLIIAVSENTKKDILRFFGCPEEKIKVVYNGYDHLAYFPAERNEGLIRRSYGYENYFLAVGPTYAHKNFEMLIRAYGVLAGSGDELPTLLIAGGKEPYISSLKRLVRTSRLEGRVVFLGYVPIGLMPSLYREAFALIFPSLYEGFGIPLLEAMACGCPVIVSNTSSMPEVGGDAVLYFDPLDMDSLLGAVRRLMGEPVLRLHLIRKGVERAGAFSWNRMACSINSIIENYFSTN